MKTSIKLNKKRLYEAFFIRIFIFICCFSSAENTQAQPATAGEQDLLIIRSFIQDIAKPEIKADVILSRHVLLELTETDEEYDYLEASIEEIRLNLLNKDLNEIECLPFADLPKKETRDIDPEGKPTEKMYFLKYKNRQMLAIYLEQGKIASFTLVSKGNRMAHFVTY